MSIPYLVPAACSIAIVASFVGARFLRLGRVRNLFCVAACKASFLLQIVYAITEEDLIPDYSSPFPMGFTDDVAVVLAAACMAMWADSRRTRPRLPDRLGPADDQQEGGSHG